MIGGKLHDEGSGFPGEGAGLFQDDAGNDDRRHAQEVSAGCDPPRAVEKSRGDQSDNGQLCAAGDKGGGHHRHAAVAFILNGAGGHDTGNTAAGADEHRDKGFSGKTEFAEYAVHHKGDSGHVAAGFQEGQKDEKHQHLRDEAENGADPADDTVKDQPLQPTGAVKGIQAFFRENGDPRHPNAVIFCGGCFFKDGICRGGNVVTRFGQRFAVSAVGFFKAAEVGFFGGGEEIFRADHTGGFRFGQRHEDGFIREGGFGVIGNGFFVSAAADAEKTEPVAEKAVVGPIGDPGADGGNGNIINDEHHRGEDRQRQHAVGNDLIDLIGSRELPGVFLLVAALQQRGDVEIAFVGDDAFGVVVHFFFGGSDVGFDMFGNFGVDVQLFRDLFVPLEDLNGVPALLFGGEIVKNGFFNMGDGVFRRTGKGVHRHGRAVPCRPEGFFHGFGNAFVFQRGDFRNGAAQFCGKSFGVDAVAVFLYDIHHVHGDHHGDPGFDELGGEVEIAL